MRINCFFAGIVFLIVGTAAATSAELPYPGTGDAKLPPRLALVIGIENYGDVGGDIGLGSLPGATQDAMKVAAILPKIGFKTDDIRLVVRTDDQPLVDKVRIQAEIKDFKERAKLAKQESHRAPVLLFYFAGHGFSTDGESYLIPSNFFADDLYSFKSNAISILHDVVQKLEFNLDPALEIIITDSCRTPNSVNIPSIVGQVTGNPGLSDPNHGRAKPLQPEPGKDRSVFFYATLDGDASFETSDTTGSAGGRFTSALVRELSEAVKNAKPPPAAPITLDNIYDDAKADLESDTGAKFQKPAFNKDWGAPFQLLPFLETFEAEGQAYKGIALQTPDPDAGLYGLSCDLQGLLKKISEFSYYSQKVIDKMHTLPGCGQGPLPLGGGVVSPPVHDESAKWYFPSLGTTSAPVAQPSPGVVRPSAPRGLLQSPTSSLRITDGAAAFRNSFAQAPSNSASASAPVPAESKPNFGEVRTAVGQQSSIEAGRLPAPNVPLDQAVVAKIDLNLRKIADPQSPVITSVAAGEILQVLGTTPGRSWLLVKHVRGTGYVSGDLVEPALMTFDKFITFDAQQYELSDEMKRDLVATFSLLGGVALVDGYVEYSESGSLLDVARASTTAKFIAELSTQADPSRKSRLYVSARSRSNALVSLKPNAVRLVMLALPLDTQTRARLAQSGAAITLEPLALGPSVPPDPPNWKSPPDVPQNPPPGPTVQLKYCGLGGKVCYLSKGIPETGQIAEKGVKDTGKTIETVAHDTGHAIETQTFAVGHEVEKSVSDWNGAIEKSGGFVSAPDGATVKSLGSLFKF